MIKTVAPVSLKGPRTLQLKLQKSSYRPYTLQLFFTTAKIFSTVSYMGNDFHNDFFEKIVVKIFVVCEGLYTHDCLAIKSKTKTTIPATKFALKALTNIAKCWHSTVTLL